MGNTTCARSPWPWPDARQLGPFSCDGGTPVCATCTAVYKTPCHYDGQGETRRANNATSSAQKRNNTSVSDPVDNNNNNINNINNNAQFLLESIRTLPESDAHDLIQHIRRDPHLDVPGLADVWRKTVTLPIHPPPEQASLERDLSLLIGKPAVTRSGESRHFGHTSGLGLVPEDENYTRSNMRLAQPLEEHQNGTWTSVTDDIAFVERLLDLYFKWSHPFYVIFSRECFYKDFRSGRHKYCNPLLVNAILAYACHFTDEPAGRTDPHNFRTAGDHFFAEARRLLYEDETPSLLTTQAMCVMSMREPSAGRDSSGFMYIGRCMRMAVELGLHLNNTSPDLNLTPSEVEVRKVTFWGCFTVETVWALCVGRISQLPRASITLDKPILDEPTLGANFYDPNPPGVVTSRVFLQEFSTLSELINDNNQMYFAPRERFTSRRLLDMYNKYQFWYQNLPAPLRLPEGPNVQPQPHIVMLHMLYYTVLVHLFRPMLKVDLIHSDLRPRDICIDSANKVTDLLRLYRKWYDMRACQLVLTHILLSVGVVHLLYSSENSTISSNLVATCQALEDLSVCHYFGARSFKIIHALAKTWNIPWPEALRLSKLVPDENAPLVSPALETLYTSRSTSSAALDALANSYGTNQSQIPTHSLNPAGPRRESLSMFATNNTRNPYPSHPALSGTAGPGLTAHTNPPSPSTIAPPSHAPAEQLFWTPMPGVGVPIIPRSNYQMSPMDLNNMLGGVDDWDRFGRDGFKMSDTWTAEAIGYGAGNGAAGPVVGSHGQHGGYEWWGGPPPGTEGQ
ncbi:fungal-specific transcription factor domain-containing protein [Dendryphion nanum]|uniref:Fungal-specific transcription factor domain-containing protein n=1 Tax=Dendryphion nanum TaxID=256645 RepID=A0A9P9DVF4_9PLEO|nr:fungal-specific transcription factor domain-containing protein [Dendryphion nanum]